jgi:hypothetical protein
VIRFLVIFLSVLMTSLRVLAVNAGWLELGNTIDLDEVAEFEMAFSSDGNRVAVMGASSQDDNELKVYNYYDPDVYSFNALNNPDWEPHADADGDGLSNIFEWTNSVFSLVTDRHSWLSARTDAISRGGHLATVSHYSDWEIVKAVAAEALSVPKIQGSVGEDDVWIGGSDVDLEGTWRWVINEPLSFTAFRPSIPNGGAAENFLQIANQEQYEPWDDANEWWELTYVLEQNDSNWVIYDTDGDGLSDGYEKTNSLTRADRADSDSDSVSDPDEINIYGTDPNTADSDGDGLSDGQEVLTFNTNPLENDDADEDGLSDYIEAIIHQTDPNDADSDGDGIGDYYEVTGEGSYFIANNMTWSNANEYAALLGGELALIKTEAQYTQVTNFLSRFSAPAQNSYVWIGGSYSNEQWYWSDHSLITPSYNATSNLVVSSETPDTFLTIKASDVTDAIDPLYNLNSDYEQVRSALIYLPGNVTDPNNSDSDDDGLDDYAEINGYGTDPNNADTDGDGFSDGVEISASHQTNAIYEIISGSYTWYQAKWDAHSRGGHLAVITSSSEYDQIEALAPGDKFLGGTDEIEEGVWKWVTSETFTNLSSWALGQPDDSGDGQDYLRITDDAPPYSYQLDDCDNHEEFVSGYILEIPNQSPLVSSDPVYQLTINVVGNGEVLPGSSGYTSNSTVNIKATSDNGALFMGWSGDMVADHQTLSVSFNIQSNMTITASFSLDADNDDLLNSEELTNGTDPRNEDTDSDGINDGDEVNTYGTDPNDADSDGDGLADGYEVTTSSTDPTDSDSDGDGLSDGDEVNTYIIDPNDSDSDDDGVSDGDEISNGTDPLAPNPPASDYALTLHFKNASAVFFNDSLSISDTIGAGCVVELLWSSNNILNTASGNETIVTNSITASNGFGYWSSASISSSELPSESGYVWARVYNKTQSRYVDLGQVDIAERVASMSSDLILAIPHSTREKQFYVMRTDGVENDILDDDNDGLSNSDELNTYNTDPQNPDSDGDGLSDGAEVINHESDPNSNDSDGDGLDDGFEATNTIYGLDININSSNAVNFVKRMNEKMPEIGGGYTLSDIVDMRLGSKMVAVSNDNAKLRFELDMSEDLTTSWQTNVHAIEVDMPVTNDVQFFRLRMD